MAAKEKAKEPHTVEGVDDEAQAKRFLVLASGSVDADGAGAFEAAIGVVLAHKPTFPKEEVKKSTRKREPRQKVGARSRQKGINKQE